MGQVAVTEAAIGRVIGALRMLEVDLGVALKASAQEMRTAVGEIEAELHARRRRLDRAEATLLAARRELEALCPGDASGRLLRPCRGGERRRTCSRRRSRRAPEGERCPEQDRRRRGGPRARLRPRALADPELDARRSLRLRPRDVSGGDLPWWGRRRHLFTPGGIAPVVQGSTAASAGCTGGTLGPVELVPLSSIDSSDSPVTGPGSFEKLSWPDAQWSTDALASVVVPAVSTARTVTTSSSGTAGRGVPACAPTRVSMTATSAPLARSS